MIVFVDLGGRLFFDIHSVHIPQYLKNNESVKSPYVVF